MAGVSQTNLLLLLGAYVLGSIPFGIIFARLFAGKDVRQLGSGNIGATNVARVVGPIPGILTLLFDATKGGFAVWAAGRLTNHDAKWMILTGIAALLGHCYPVWLRFKGGKGVATAIGLFAVLCYTAAITDFVIFLLVLAFWRFVSLASVSAAAAMPLLVYLLWAPGHAPPLSIIFGTLFCAALVIFKHDANLQRLVEGTEPVFFGKKSQGEPQ